MLHQMLLKVRDIVNTRIYPLVQLTIKKYSLTLLKIYCSN